jgi:Zn-dependent peptidase ImmA (M78 family)/formiminotetrahydrofolate cyclodeaminase
MREKLLDRKARRLLHDFGTGGHEPGSGSAAAVMGILAAQLTCNVIDLTERYKDRSKIYQAHLEELISYRTLMKNRIIPVLDELTEEDSIQFDKVIQARIARRNETDYKLKEIKHQIVQSETRIATELPIKIARYAYNIGRMATKAFDYGYVGAKGETLEGILFASSAMQSCLGIIDLNLQQLPVDAWMEKIRSQKKRLEQEQQELENLARGRSLALKNESEEHYQYERKLQLFRAGNMADKFETDGDIERLVDDLHEILWVNKEKIWKKEGKQMTDFIQVLKPQDVLLHYLHYQVIPKDTLGRHYEGKHAFEVAGLIDKPNKLVEVSRQFPLETMRFTLAHELGHAILHPGTLFHRDRPIDGSIQNLNPIEKQADYFAACFLMPRKLVEKVVHDIFHTSVIVINEQTVFQLGAGSIESLRASCIYLRGFSRYIVRVRRYGGTVITPLAAIFGVSDEAMAIRLEELGLIVF